MSEASINYAEMTEYGVENKCRILQRNNILKKQEQQRTFYTGKRKRAPVLPHPWFDYAVQPQSQIEEDTNDRNQFRPW